MSGVVKSEHSVDWLQMWKFDSASCAGYLEILEIVAPDSFGGCLKRSVVWSLEDM